MGRGEGLFAGTVFELGALGLDFIAARFLAAARRPRCWCWRGSVVWSANPNWQHPHRIELEAAIDNRFFDHTPLPTSPWM